ncbi:MAG: glycine cleavage system aminomethyltransferase GcvT [Actinomycetota bacterium]
MAQTVLHDEHVKLGASFTDFGGWDMPVRYSSDLAEHHAVRNAAGIFDISHMAEIFVSGDEAAAFLDHALVGIASEIAIGRAKYSMICNKDGGIVDDLIVYRLGDDSFLVIANAGNRHAVAHALHDRKDTYEVLVEDQSDDWALIAVQGPKATSVLQRLTETDLNPLKYYSIAASQVADVSAYLCRTGYTGEDGFEVLVASEHASAVWNAILSAGADDGLIAAGLACRDTLRLEAGMPLYGHELDDDHTPFEAGLGRVVRLDDGHDFVGRHGLEKRQEPAERLVGIVGEGKRAARAEYELKHPETGKTIGRITSGALSPTLGHPVAMAYVSDRNFEVGDTISVDVRGSLEPYKIVKLPFYKREQ